ncbi:effector-associated constant component EACC1 [Streptomyces sp. NPDC002623]
MTVELRVFLSNGGQLESLRAWLDGHQGVAVEARERPPEPNSQGTVWDFLAVVCAAGGPLVAAVHALQLWIQGQVTDIELEVGDRRFKVTGRNAQAVLQEVIETAKSLEAGSDAAPERSEDPEGPEGSG